MIENDPKTKDVPITFKVPLLPPPSARHVIDVIATETDFQSRLKPLGVPSFTSAEFAVEMVEGAGELTYKHSDGSRHSAFRRDAADARRQARQRLYQLLRGSHS